MVTFKRARFSFSALGLVVVALLVAACGGYRSSKPSSPAAGSNSPTAAKLTIGTGKGPMGTYLTGSSGRALYLWVADTSGASNCSGECARVWPPVLASATPNVAGGVNASDLGTIARGNGSKQVTYNGHPLYYYLADPRAGTTHGQGNDGFGAKWWLVAPSGAGITATAVSTSSSPGSSSSGSPSGW
jgi:predicted lipoprotein with Yx(FWY)xxD motif